LFTIPAWIRFTGRILGWGVLTVLVGIFLLLVILRVPAVQRWLGQQAAGYLSGKTGTDIRLAGLSFSYRGNAELTGLFVPTSTGDTLLYSGKLSAGIRLLPLIRGKYVLKPFKWEDAVVNVVQNQDSTFNFSYLISAFTAGKPAEIVSDTTQTASESIKLDFSGIDLARLRLHYTDKLSGDDYQLSLEKLTLQPEEINFDSLFFEVKSLEIVGLSARLKLVPSKEQSTDTTTSRLPRFQLGILKLRNIRFELEQPGERTMTAHVQDFRLENTGLNLDHQAIVLGTLHGDGLLFSMLSEAGTPPPPTDDKSSTPFVFNWPVWRYQAARIQLKNYRILLKNKGSKPSPGVFNANDLQFDLHQLSLTTVSGKAGQVKIGALALSADEKSGAQLKAVLALSADEKTVSINKLALDTRHSRLLGEIELSYKDFTDLLNRPMDQQLYLQLNEGTRLSLEDALYFKPELSQDTVIGPLIPYPVQLAGTVRGNQRLLRFDDWDIRWGQGTRLRFSGTATDITDTLKYAIVLPELALQSTARDLGLIAKEEGFRYPEQIDLQASASASQDAVQLQMRLLADGGTLLAEADLQGLRQEMPVYSLQLDAASLPVGRWIQDSLLGKAGWHAELNGQGFDPKTLSATAKIDFNQLQYQGYDYKNLVIAGGGASGLWNADITHEDTALGLAITASATLDTLWPAYTLYAKLDRADLKKLGFSPEPYQLRFVLDVKGNGQLDSFQVSAGITDGLVMREATAYPLQKFELKAAGSPAKSALQLESDVLTGNFEANTGLEALLAAVTTELRSQWKLDSTGVTDSSRTDIRASGAFEIPESRLLKEVLIPGLQELDSGKVSFYFDQESNKLDLSARIKNVSYDGTAVRNLFVDFRGDAGLQLLAGFDRMEQGKIDIHETRLQVRLADSLLLAGFTVKDAKKEAVFRVQAEGGWQTGNRYFSLVEDSLLLNREAWKAQSGNRVSLGDKPAFENFSIRQGERMLTLSSADNQQRLSFNHFPLSAFTSLLQADTLLAEGELNGSLALTGSGDRTTLVSDLEIDSLRLLGQLMGKLTLDAASTEGNNYKLNAGLSGPDIQLDMTGNYQARKEGANLDLNLDLSKFALKQLVVLSDSALKEAKGNMSARLSLKGPVSKPEYAGQLQFTDANVKVGAFNAAFGLGSKPLRVNKEGLIIDAFELTDEKGQRMRVDGKVLTGDRPEAVLDLQLTTRDFQVLNSTRADNSLFFGVMRINADLKLSGTLDRPVIDAKARLNKGSKLTVIVPESQIDVVERDGVVIFSRIDPATDTLIDMQEQKLTGLTGIRLKAQLEVDKESELKLLIDERSGDNLTLAGTADLRYDLFPNGRSSMTGVYEISRGQYDLSLYELVKRKFELVPGGRIVWNGDLTDAQMDLQALYRIKTSASDLMSAQLSSADESTVTRYRQELPFEVYMNIKGQLLKPSISFALDMPEQQRNALDGNVYARIQQLNQNESDLNKQVFSLMVLNRFVPEGQSGSPGGGSAAANMARSSVSQLLSSQLNNLSAQYIKGVDLNMNLDSYTDYTTGMAQDRTQLNVNLRKNFLGDRLAVELGRQVDVQGSSQASNDIIGDVSIEYKLSKDGSYRLRGFRRNQTEGLAEGPLIVTGMSLVLNKEFNGFDELLKKKAAAKVPEIPQTKPETVEPPKKEEKP